jgi:hypothetical protein
MTKSVSCNTNCPHCRARVTLPQAFDMEKVNEITRRIRHEVDAMDALLTPSVSPRVVTPPRATPAVHVSSRTSVPATLQLSASTSVPALATIRISWSTPSPPVLAPPGTSVATPVPSGTSSAAPTPPVTPSLVWLPPTTSTPAPEPPMAFVSVSASATAAPSAPVPMSVDVARTAPQENRITTATTSQAAGEVNSSSATADGTPDLLSRLLAAFALTRPAAATARADERANRAARNRRRTGRYGQEPANPVFDLRALSELMREKDGHHLVTSRSHLYYDYSEPATRTATDTLPLADGDTRRPFQPRPTYQPARQETAAHASNTQRISCAELASRRERLLVEQEELKKRMRDMELLRELQCSRTAVPSDLNHQRLQL